MTLSDAARAAGILPSYVDLSGQTRLTSAATAEALLAAMGLDEHTVPVSQALPDYVICATGSAPDMALGPWTLTYESGAVEDGRGTLPPLPLGRHKLVSEGQTSWVLSAPPSLPLPPRAWGLIVPLACLRPPQVGGIGTFSDLAELAASIAPSGAAYLGINPVHAGFLSDPGGFSPYTPSHRRRLSPLYLPAETEDTPGALVDFANDTPARLAALEAAFAAADLSVFDGWLGQQDDGLTRFALHQALSEHHGPHWNTWPHALRTPAGAAASAAAQGLSDRMRFHSWLQFRAETALTEAQQTARAAGMAHGLYLDLAVGTHPFGAETWEDPQSFARGASLGAPPDAFSKDGQNWCLAPFNPHHLKATGFAALAETLRAQLRFAGALRIDHILGFERAFWVPDNGAPGGYVAMPRDAMLAVLRIEAARAGAVIVGEDLGNIPEGLRAALEASGVLGCRVMMFERDNPAFRAPGSYNAASIASFSTHDLPTWAGWRQGADLDAHHAIGTFDSARRDALLNERRAEVSAFDAMTGSLGADAPSGSLEAMTHALAHTGSRLVALQVEDILGLTQQPNLPGTVTEYPNWRQRLPLGPREIAATPAFRAAARAMSQSSR